MRHRLHVLPLALVIASSLRCSDGPTQPPIPQTPRPTASPTPVALDLNGAWTGTLFYGPTFRYGGSSCPSESIRVQLSHGGSKISGNFDTSCVGKLYVTGKADGTSLSIDLYKGLDLVARLKGHTTSAAINVSGAGTNLLLSR